MDLTSGCRQSSPDPLGGPGGGADRISALPDDLLLLILARLRCIATAVRTSVLSRRWSEGLWTRLREVTFRDVALDSLESALTRVSPAVSLLEIHVPKPLMDEGEDEDPAFQNGNISSLLRTAARLAPENFVLALPSDFMITPIFVDLPCFHRATSIMIDSDFFILMLPAGIQLPALDTLFLSGCIIVDLDTLLSRCPHLRVLSFEMVNQFWLQNYQELTVHSASLQELIVDTQKTWKSRVDIVAPSLKQLIVSLGSDKELNISILAPMLEVSWHCYFSWGAMRFGIWCLDRLSLKTAERQGQLSSLHIHACSTNFRDFFQEGLNFKQEIEKHLVAEFSVLELDLRTNGHVFGSFVLHLLGMNRIRSATRRLKVVIPRSMEKEACRPNCLCVPTDWRTQITSFTALEEVEIDGFDREEHEFNFLRLICRCAPMLKRVIVKLSHEVSSSNDGCTQICNIVRAYSCVECKCLS